MEKERKTRTIYLENTDIEEAVTAYRKRFQTGEHRRKVEKVDIRDSLGRMTATPVIARISSPNHNAAAMDGIQVHSAATFQASDVHPLELKKGKDYLPINTGQSIDPSFDCVIMIEDVIEQDAQTVRITAPASPWQHVRPVGEDIVAGEMVLPAHHEIRPQDIGAVLGSGVEEIQAFERIRVGILPTGNEITDSYRELSDGKSFDTNSWTMAAMVRQWGGIPQRKAPVSDDPDLLKKAMQELLMENHIVVINAGSSAGSRDYTADIIRERGEVLYHGLSIRPGKPTIFGIVDGKPVLGVPGYPGSAFLVFEEVVEPLFRDFSGRPKRKRPMISATLSRRVVSSLKYREYLQVKLGQVGDKLIATPLNRGAGMMMSLVRADGVLVIPQNSEGIDGGEEVSIQLKKEMEDVERTIVSIGSHDLVMDHIGNFLEDQKFHLASTHVGSMGGIMALLREEAHIAPIHLLDESTGNYNEAFLERYLTGRDVTLVKGIRREQGLMVQPGNPKGIQSIDDLSREEIVFVNRQRGSGTRVLTDYLLKKAQIDTASIKGYSRDMMTHMAVAAAVNSETADVGVGVRSAAKTMGLEFIPIGFEDYDFAIPTQYMQTEPIQAFLGVLGSKEFEEIIKELGGYELAL